MKHSNCEICKKRNDCQERVNFTALCKAIAALSDATWNTKNKEGHLHCYCSIKVDCDYFDWDMITDGWRQTEVKVNTSPIICYNTSCLFNNSNYSCQDTCSRYLDKPYIITKSNHTEVD